MKYQQQNANRSEAVIGDKKLSVELYVSQAAFFSSEHFFCIFNISVAITADYLRKY